MAENIFSTFAISGQGMAAQRKRLAAVSKNIANVNTTNAKDGQPYQREIVTVKSAGNGSFGKTLKEQVQMVSSGEANGNNSFFGNNYQDNNVLTVESEFDKSEPRMVYDPSHPQADEKGYVKMPNINIVTEMVEMLTAQKAFEANASVIESAKNIARDSLDI